MGLEELSNSLSRYYHFCISYDFMTYYLIIMRKLLLIYQLFSAAHTVITFSCIVGNVGTKF